VNPKQQFKVNKAAVTAVQKEFALLEESLALVSRKTNSTHLALEKFRAAIANVKQSVKKKSPFEKDLRKLEAHFKKLSTDARECHERMENTSLPHFHIFPTINCVDTIENLKKHKDNVSTLQGKLAQKTKADLDAGGSRESKSATLEMELQDSQKKTAETTEAVQKMLEEFEKGRKKTIGIATREFLHAQLVYHSRAIETLTEAWKTVENVLAEAEGDGEDNGSEDEA